MLNQPKYGVVLLPPPDEWDWLQQLNLIVNGGMEHPPIVLGDGQKPHASLAHLYVSSPDVLIRPVTEILQRAHPLTLDLPALSVDTIGENTWTSVIIKDTPELHQLHVDVMNVVLPFEVATSRFRESFSYDKFFPHFTVGVNVIPSDINFIPRQVTIDRVALCEMNPPYSTCGTIITEWKLG